MPNTTNNNELKQTIENALRKFGNTFPSGAWIPSHLKNNFILNRMGRDLFGYAKSNKETLKKSVYDFAKSQNMIDISQKEFDEYFNEITSFLNMNEEAKPKTEPKPVKKPEAKKAEPQKESMGLLGGFVYVVAKAFGGFFDLLFGLRNIVRNKKVTSTVEKAITVMKSSDNVDSVIAEVGKVFKNEVGDISDLFSNLGIGSFLTQFMQSKTASADTTAKNTNKSKSKAKP